MPQPFFYSEGNTPRLRDTKLKITKKWLGRIQDDLGEDNENNPLPNDTMRQTEEKINRALTGTT